MTINETVFTLQHTDDEQSVLKGLTSEDNEPTEKPNSEEARQDNNNSTNEQVPSK